MEDPRQPSTSPITARVDMGQWRQSMAGEAELSRFEKGGRSFFVIAATHFSDAAISILEEEIAPEVTDSLEWMFLIEGSQSQAAMRIGGEARIATDMAVARGIPVFDPIFDTYDRNVIEYLLQTSGRGLDRGVVFATRGLAIQQLFQDGAHGRLSQAQLDEKAARHWKMTPSEFKSYFKKSAQIVRTDEQRVRADSRRTNELILGAANMVCAQVLDYYLRQNPQSNKVLMYIGRLHREMLDIDLGSLAKEERLSDDKIKKMVSDRDRLG